jgi:hypothetical protein
MTFKARVDVGDWANQVRRMMEATKQTMEEVLRGQAKLLVRDCIVMTPPCEKRVPLRRYKLKARLDEQFKIGQKAIIRDVMRIFVPHDSRKVFSITGKSSSTNKDRRRDKLANYLAEIAITGDVGKLNRTLITSRHTTTAGTFSKIAKHADLVDHKDRRKDGKIAWKGNRVLLHDGNAQPYNPGYNAPDGWQTNASIRSIVEALSVRVGMAKAGWVDAAKAMRLSVPRMLSKVNQGGGIVRVETGGAGKVSITVGSTVPYMQSIGAKLRIVERAWEERKANIKLQASITKYGRKRGLFVRTNKSSKGPKITKAPIQVSTEENEA